MRFVPLQIAGAVVIEPEPQSDERGLFARTFCKEEFERAGLPVEFVQRSTSFNALRGTLRGMHFQTVPHEEGKVVRCTRGSVFDVVLDLRPRSPTYCQWRSVELGADNRRAVYVPPGCAHGFQALEDRSEVYYEITEAYRAEHSSGARWDDPAFRIVWPIAAPILSRRDAAFPDWRRA